MFYVAKEDKWARGGTAKGKEMWRTGGKTKAGAIGRCVSR